MTIWQLRIGAGLRCRSRRRARTLLSLVACWRSGQSIRRQRLPPSAPTSCSSCQTITRHTPSPLTAADWPMLPRHLISTAWPAKGALLTNVFCTNSICSPSRACVLTGQYCHTNGAFDLSGRVAPEQQMLALQMRQALPDSDDRQVAPERRTRAVRLLLCSPRAGKNTTTRTSVSAATDRGVRIPVSFRVSTRPTRSPT